jgi:hypothetical protein
MAAADDLSVVECLAGLERLPWLQRRELFRLKVVLCRENGDAIGVPSAKNL